MPLQPPNFFGLVDPTNPKGTDSRTISDDYHRMILQSLKNQAPNWQDAITAAHGDINLLAGLAAAGAKLLTGNAGVSVTYAYNNTAWVGWVVEDLDVNIRQLVIGPAAGGAATGGLEDPTDNTYNLATTVSISGTTDNASVPHTHPFSGTTGDADSGPYNLGGGGFPGVPPNHGHPFSGTTNQPSDTNHAHPVSLTGGSGTGTLQIQPRYARGILIKLES